jgi:hypothetical protein
LNTEIGDQRYDRPMPDTPPEGFPPEPDPIGIPSAPPPGWPFPPAPDMTPRGHPRWPVPIMLVLTLIAGTAAVAAWLRPIPDTPASTAPPTFSEQRVANAKSRVCAGYQKIRRALDDNSTQDDSDPNTLQIYIAGSAYLLTVLTEEPATPSNLAAAARKLARLFQILALEGLASDPSVQAHNAADQTLSTIKKLCK